VSVEELEVYAMVEEVKEILLLHLHLLNVLWRDVMQDVILDCLIDRHPIVEGNLIEDCCHLITSYVWPV